MGIYLNLKCNEFSRTQCSCNSEKLLHSYSILLSSMLFYLLCLSLLYSILFHYITLFSSMQFYYFYNALFYSILFYSIQFLCSVMCCSVVFYSTTLNTLYGQMYVYNNGLGLFFSVWAPWVQWRVMLMSVLQHTKKFYTIVCFQLCGNGRRPFPVPTWQCKLWVHDIAWHSSMFDEFGMEELQCLELNPTEHL